MLRIFFFCCRSFLIPLSLQLEVEWFFLKQNKKGKIKEQSQISIPPPPHSLNSEYCREVRMSTQSLLPMKGIKSSNNSIKVQKPIRCTLEDADWITKGGIKKHTVLSGKTKMSCLSSQNQLTLEEHIVLIKMIPMRSFLGPVPQQ